MVAVVDDGVDGSHPELRKNYVIVVPFFFVSFPICFKHSLMVMLWFNFFWFKFLELV